MMNNPFKEKISRILINQEFCKERTVSTFFKNHQVTINSFKIKDWNIQADAEKDSICVDGKRIKKIKHIYLALNKPEHYVCSTVSDSHKTVFELIPGKYKKKNGGQLHCAGRLDAETSGLIILTTNGAFSHFLTTPENCITKSYYVELEKSVSEEERRLYSEKCRNGFEVCEDKKSPAFISKPAFLEWKNADNNYDCKEVFITVTEGKFHEVRRIFSTLGNNVTRLERISIGKIELDKKLKKGKYKRLKRKELEELLICKEQF